MKALMVLVLCLQTFSFAKKAEPAWQNGKLINQSSQSRCKTSAEIRNGNGSMDETCIVYSFYEIDDGSMIYIVRRDIKFRWDKDLDVTVNAPVRFAIEGRKGYIMDEQGKSHEVRVVQKTKK